MVLGRRLERERGASHVHLRCLIVTRIVSRDNEGIEQQQQQQQRSAHEPDHLLRSGSRLRLIAENPSQSGAGAEWILWATLPRLSSTRRFRQGSTGVSPRCDAVTLDVRIARIIMNVESLSVEH